MRISVDIWEKEPGKSPAGEFINSLEPKEKKKVDWILTLLEEKGMALLGSGHFVKLKSYDLFETRFSQNKKEFRLLGVMRQSIYFILHGFIKKSPKGSETPKKEIKTTLERARILDEQINKKT